MLGCWNEDLDLFLKFPLFDFWEFSRSELWIASDALRETTRVLQRCE